MKWSKIKSRFEARLADSLRGQLRVHVTEYTKAGMDVGRGWITFDGDEVISVRIPSFYDDTYTYASDTLDFGRAVGDYLDTSARDALASAHPILQGLALLDRKIGRKTLAGMETETLHPFCQTLYNCRCAAEGLATRELVIGPEHLPAPLTWTLRRAAEDDAPGLTACIKSAYRSHAENIPDLPNVSEGVAEDIADKRVWVVEIGGKVAAGIILAEHDGGLHVVNLAVHPARAGLGLARALMEQAEADCRELGLAEMHLATHVAIPENVRFYQHLGWHETGREGNKVLLRKVVDKKTGPEGPV